MTPSRTLYAAARKLGMSGPIERLHGRDALQALLVAAHGEAALADAVAAVRRAATVGPAQQLRAAALDAMRAEAQAITLDGLVRAIVREEIARLTRKP